MRIIEAGEDAGRAAVAKGADEVQPTDMAATAEDAPDEKAKTDAEATPAEEAKRC